MHWLMTNLIRLAKQRVDIEKPRHKTVVTSRHKTVVTSDVQHQISVMNQKAKDNTEKKHADEAEKLHKLKEAEGESGINVDMDKDRVVLKTPKANVAARAAMGGDDLTLKWLLLAKKAQQKDDGGLGTSSTAHSSENKSNMPSPTSERAIGDVQAPQEKGTEYSFQGDQLVMPQKKLVRSLSVKDVIAIMEREPQMSKSTFAYCLHERLC
ncbi:hypothetical protein L1049_015528 [Liquidambar formosana]|uniref:Transcription initiation factor TFIID component TAF4 C-terminal domain-containing protein n=1 Tax=Liquidambar formosana TaxID=63359 RepID=A0AAP0S4W3_LIQFO